MTFNLIFQIGKTLINSFVRSAINITNQYQNQVKNAENFSPQNRGKTHFINKKWPLWQLISQKINEIDHIFYLILVELTFFY